MSGEELGPIEDLDALRERYHDALDRVVARRPAGSRVIVALVLYCVTVSGIALALTLNPAVPVEWVRLALAITALSWVAFLKIMTDRTRSADDYAFDLAEALVAADDLKRYAVELARQTLTLAEREADRHDAFTAEIAVAAERLVGSSASATEADTWSAANAARIAKADERARQAQEMRAQGEKIEVIRRRLGLRDTRHVYRLLRRPPRD